LEGDQEVVKWSGRNKSIPVVMHMCMDAMLGISLCIPILISTSKNALSFLLLLMSSLQQNWRRGQKRFCLEARRVAGERAGTGNRGKKWPKQCMYL
jgi:hypothetical protein